VCVELLTSRGLQEQVSASLTAKDAWDPMIEMKRAYEPIDAKIREAATEILAAKEDISASWDELVKSVKELEEAFLEKNKDLIRDLADRIKALPDHDVLSFA
jgi:hypothetical protein